METKINYCIKYLPILSNHFLRFKSKMHFYKVLNILYNKYFLISYLGKFLSIVCVISLNEFR